MAEIEYREADFRNFSDLGERHGGDELSEATDGALIGASVIAS